MSIESSIDDLYKGSLADFVGARNALAKTLAGADAKRVKALQKPTVVPWIVNQIYWRARPLYDRVLETGRALRAAQVSMLEGRKTDVRGATDRYRQAIAGAVNESKRIAAEAGIQPNPDDVARTLESLSMASKPAGRPELSEQAGRLTQTLSASAGFEALAGIAVKAPGKAVPIPFPRPVPDESRHAAKGTAADRRRLEEARAREKEAAVAHKKKQEALRKAEAAVARAEAAEAAARDTLDAAREAWNGAKEVLRHAQDNLSALQDDVS